LNTLETNIREAAEAAPEAGGGVRFENLWSSCVTSVPRQIPTLRTSVQRG